MPAARGRGSGGCERWQTVDVGFRRVAELGVDACDVVFEDEGHVLAVDDNADVWRVGLDGTRVRVGAGVEIHAVLADALTRGRAWQAMPRVPTPRQITFHSGSGGLVVHVDHFGLWSLVGRVHPGAWQLLATDSQILSYPFPTWSPDGTLLAVNVEQVAVVDPTLARPRRVLTAEAWGWTPSGQLLLYDYETETASWVFCVADPATGQRQVLGKPEADFSAVAPDRATVVINYERGVRLWNLATAEPLTAILETLTSARPAPSGHRYLCRSSEPHTDQRPDRTASSWSIRELT